MNKGFKSETTSFQYFSPGSPKIWKVCTLDRKWGEKTVKRSEKHQYKKKPCSVRQNSPKNKPFYHGNLTPFISEKFQIWDHFFPILFLKDSKSVKSLDIRLQELGAKRRLNGISKVNRRTNRQTDIRTDILTYRNHRPREPMLWKCTFYFFV